MVKSRFLNKQSKPLMLSFIPSDSRGCMSRRYWEMKEQRTPTLKGKLTQKADQEQQDPLEYLQSDEEDDEKRGAQRRLQEQRERLHGALALIELANLTGAPLRQ